MKKLLLLTMPFLFSGCIFIPYANGTSDDQNTINVTITKCISEKMSDGTTVIGFEATDGTNKIMVWLKEKEGKDVKAKLSKGQKVKLILCKEDIQDNSEITQGAIKK